jgi:hypothetical protein
MRIDYKTIQKELLWYYNNSAAAIGYKSSFGSFVSALYGVSPAIGLDPDPFTDAMLADVARLRRIESTLSQLPIQSKRALDATYDRQHVYPLEVVSLFGLKAGCALFNSHTDTMEHLVALCKAKLLKKQTSDEKKVSFLIGTETKELYVKIHEEFQVFIDKAEIKRTLH